MTDEELVKAKEFYEFLKSISKCTHGFLAIDRKKLIDLARVFMDLSSPYEAHEILMKMVKYGWIKEIKMDYVVVNLG
ncbi:MAG: hypothetical protein JHC26_00540 [Thermofilum sp.]|uniref:hypothetical protein n=1 Tax=Thermofilum sp. TaxID=1961369 RepID=UPI00258F0C17|nr:hypothetical protein [Thermofilum sp.]MCI4407553.1 hypothetical protein [Thermofilum sp.]